MKKTDGTRIRRETIEECAKIANETSMPSDAWIRQWQPAIVMETFTQEERVAFSHADFIAEQIRALAAEDSSNIAKEATPR